MSQQHLLNEHLVEPVRLLDQEQQALERPIESQLSKEIDKGQRHSNCYWLNLLKLLGRYVEDESGAKIFQKLRGWLQACCHSFAFDNTTNGQKSLYTMGASALQ